MASLQGQEIKDTYQSLLKTNGNTAINGTLQTITDGQGNATALSLATGSLHISSSYSQGVGYSNQLHYIIYKAATLSSGSSTKLSLDGTGTTGLLLPTGNSAWGVEMDAVAFCSASGGTVATGSSYMGKYSFLYSYVNSTGSIVGINTAATTFSPSMSSAVFTITTGSSQDLEIKFDAPTTATNTGFRLVANLSITQVTY